MAEPRPPQDGGAASSSDDDMDDPGALLAGPQGDEEWEEWADEEGAEEERTRSLFGPEVLGSPAAAMDHDAAAHGFDLRQWIARVGGGEPTVGSGVCMGRAIGGRSAPYTHNQGRRGLGRHAPAGGWIDGAAGRPGTGRQLPQCSS